MGLDASEAVSDTGQERTAILGLEQVAVVRVRHSVTYGFWIAVYGDFVVS